MNSGKAELCYFDTLSSQFNYVITGFLITGYLITGKLLEVIYLGMKKPAEKECLQWKKIKNISYIAFDWSDFC